jgi:aspartyl-tRNA(Asn)/glutamyl-tRNA(Gln) amidotransferase subunit C
MTLTREEVEHIAALAHLHLEEEETEKYRRQLTSILDYAEKLRRVDTSSIPPTTTVLPIRTVLREDTAHTSLDRDAALANTVEKERNMFRIPSVFE